MFAIRSPHINCPGCKSKKSSPENTPKVKIKFISKLFQKELHFVQHLLLDQLLFYLET